MATVTTYTKAALDLALAGKLDDTQLGAPNGVAPLGADQKVPLANLPDNIGGGGTYVPRVYEHGPINDGDFVTGASLLTTPVRISDDITLQTFEMSLSPKPTTGTVVFSFRRTTGTEAPVEVATVSVGSSGVARPSPAVSQAFLEGDLLDIWCTENTSDVSSGTIVAMIDSRVAAETATGPAAPVTTPYGWYDSFTRPDSTTSLGTTEQNNLPYIVDKVWGIQNNAAYLVDRNANGSAVADAKKVNHKIAVRFAGLIRNGGAFLRVIAAYLDVGNYFVVEVLSDGSIGLKKIVNYAATDLGILPAGTIAAGTPFEIALERVNGNQFMTYIDGVVRAELSTDTLQTEFPTATFCGMGFGNWGSSTPMALEATAT